MKKYLMLYAFLIMALSLMAREDRVSNFEQLMRLPRITETDVVSFPGGRCMMYRLYLRDKDLQHTPFSVNRPEQFLSARSIERRKRQGLPVDVTDLPIAPAYLDSVSRMGIEIVGQSKWNNTLLVKIHKEKELNKLNSLSFITKKLKVFSSPDSITERKRSSFRKELNSWESVPIHYGAAAEQLKSLGGQRIHERGFYGNGMMIAVFDGGFMNVDRIPALHGVKLAGLKDFVVPKSNNIFEEMEHGTMVLSTMAANAPNLYVGVAPEAQYVLVRCEDERTESLAEEDYWASAAEYADSLGVDVINSSLGYHDFDDVKTNHLYWEQDGETALISHTASMCADKGIICVNSAGNDGMGVWKKINFPADAKNILTVGSINEQGKNAAFSAVGPTADGRIKPDVMAYGSPTSVITGRGAIINDNGTSFSSPLIAGMTACLWQALPHKTAKQIIKLVKMAGNNQQHPDNIYGYGVPDFWKAYQTGKAIK
ncbi:S8 family peptidase [Segatella hominis]|uniref:S8 family peptidase n=1 Tax=Segatella hominis TaxID=2518605 RepID=UPI001F17948B|nr:S8 family serine peptidase [Segatella hominis]